MPSVRAFAVGFGGFHKAVAVDEAVDGGNIFDCRDNNALSTLYSLDKVRDQQQGGHGAGVKPDETAAEELHVQQAVVQVHLVEHGDLQFTSRQGLT